MYGTATYLQWTYDDTQIIKQAIQYSPCQYFFVPEIWQELSWTNLTPLVTFSFEADLALFGLNPQMFYIHHLIVIWLCSIMFYMVLRLWVPRIIALTGAFLFLIGSPLAVVSQQLMARHYIEGLLFATASFWFFVSGLRKGKTWMVVCSVFFYMGALSAKEIYIPLVFLFPVLRERNFKARLTNVLPFLGVLLFYTIWRFHMLDVFLGFYGSIRSHEVTVKDAVGIVLLFFKQAVTTLFGLNLLREYIIASVILIPISIFLFRRVRVAIFCIWAGVLTSLPILPVISESSVSRYFLLTWFMISVLLTFVLSFLWSFRSLYRFVGIVLIASVSIFTLLYNRNVWAHQFALSQQLSAEGNFVLIKATERDLLRRQIREPIDFEGLNWLRRHYYHFREDASGFSDDIYLCENTVDGKRVWSYSEEYRGVIDITSLVVNIKEKFCDKIRTDVPLRVRVVYSGAGPLFSWDFGPYEEGHYAIILGAVTEKYDLPPAGTIRLFLSRALLFRVRYDSPDGWITYSPFLTVTLSNDSSQILWERDCRAPS
jgi:hypothetical protein